MSGTSSVTVPVNFRIPKELAEKIQRRIDKRPGKWSNINQYCRERFIYDVQRKH